MVTLENTTWKIPFCAACYTDSNNYKHTYNRQSQTGQNMSRKTIVYEIDGMLVSWIHLKLHAVNKT